MRRTIFRWSVRTVCLAAAVVLALGGPLPTAAARVVPALSPLVLAAGSITSRSWYAGLFWGLPAAVVLVTAVFRGRFFCRWLCPAGTLYSSAARVSLKKRLLGTRVNGVVFWIAAAGALVGFPFLLALDPLSSFNRMTPLIHGWPGLAALIPGLLVPVFLILSVIQPVVWCSHVCPLGYLFDVVHVRRRRPLIKQDRTRREVVTGLAVGVPLGLFGHWLGFAPRNRGAGEKLPVLPPGAESPREFAALCTRCYACVNVCPTDVLRVKMPVGRSLGQYFHPELDTHATYCDEFCNACGQVCPAGAIAPLSVDQKRQRKIGTARVIREACLAWTDGEICMVCDEYCPYFAITTSMSEDGIPRPTVNEEICRGCGVCEANCPAVRMGRAIVVDGVAVQSRAREFEFSAPDGEVGGHG